MATGIEQPEAVGVRRTPREVKPSWAAVPLTVRQRTEELLGAAVTRAVRVYGGYGPSATFRLRLADGQRAFVKATYPLPEGSAVEWALEEEERVYRRVGHLIAGWAPRYHGSVRRAGWHALVLDDVGPSTAPPWTSEKARAAMRAFGAFHTSTFGRELPRWLPRPRDWTRMTDGWERLAGDRDGLARLAGLAGARSEEARGWLAAYSPRLRDEALAFADTRPPYALLHLDARSDNLRIHPRAATPLRLFDWPFACVGPPEIDFAFFAQTVTCEGGPGPHELTGWYAERGPLRDVTLGRAVATVAGFFAARAWQPELAELPRLRSWQRQQLRVSLAWAADLLGLPGPGWIEQVPG